MISVKLEVSYTFSIYFWLFIKAALCQVVILWPSSVTLSLSEILHSAIPALLLSLNQSSKLALLYDRGRTLSRPRWRLREMYICLYWLISPGNIMQGSVVLMLKALMEGKLKHDHLQRLTDGFDPRFANVILKCLFRFSQSRTIDST